MGNRAQIILTKEYELEGELHKHYSPTIYLHWNGSLDEVLTMVDKLAEVMAHREGDLDYATARLIGLYHESIEGNLSLGVWNNKQNEDDILAENPGDNGTYFVDCKTFEVMHHSYSGTTHYTNEQRKLVTDE